MEILPLADTGLPITTEEVANLFEPFVQRHPPADDPEWKATLAVRKKKILSKYLRRRLLPGWQVRHQRNEQNVIEEYSDVWQKTAYANYSPDQVPQRFSPWEWGDDRMLASTFGATRVRQLLLIRVVEQTRPRSVLEVGCGNGINLLLLSCRFPEIEFAGLELTEQGHRAAREMQALASLPREMQDFAPLELRDPAAFRRIRFVRGSAAELPFEGGEFDLVYTSLALEQMERIRPTALGEIARVTARNALMIEPFRDINDKGWPRLNVLRRNYFEGRIDDLPAYGLRPLFATDDFPQESFLKVCAVLSEKTA